MLKIFEAPKMKIAPKSTVRKLITRDNPKSPISEGYRMIRTNIEFSMVDQQLKTLLCTSSKPNEGKSTTIANLAITFAQQGKKVLIVDADLRRPTIHQTFQMENRFGLTSVLAKKVRLERAISTTSVEGLSVMTSGPLPPNPSELLGSNMMKELILRLTNSYDMVLFDAPPVLAVTDAQVLGNICDGTLLVVKSKETEKEEIVKAKERLEKAGIQVIGVVLNGTERKESNYCYY